MQPGSGAMATDLETVLQVMSQKFDHLELSPLDAKCISWAC